MTPTRGSWRIGVDIGGTFTDVALDKDGALHSTKVLTDYAAPERAIIKGVLAIIAEAGLRPADIDILIHGTTLATNALVERRGAKTAFITTEGFRDVLEMRTESRFEQYDLEIVLPTPLIERCDRYTLRERIDAGGRVLAALEEEEIAALVERIAAGCYQSVAVGFLHSYANGRHEELVRDALRRRLPRLPVSISSEVSPQMRELERFNTVCANAYVMPAVTSYLDRLVAALRDVGLGCPVFMIHSGGGIISVESASKFPVRLVESGPAGGAVFAAHIASRYGLASALAFDMGGTTAKICLLEGQVPKAAKTFEVARTYRFRKGSGMPISIPAVEMVDIGAGGGSIASVDLLRQIRVGPHSAGSEPGPVCYQRGGEAPTVTDADLVLGRLDADNFAGGSIPLSAALAADAIARGVGAKLGLDGEAAAHGICEVVDENMANAGRMHAVESGKDIAAYTMITFGGAGPVHAARLCEKMGISKLIVPPGAGVGSAIGFLRAPFAYEAVRSAMVRIADFDPAVVNQIVSGMADEALAFVREGTTDRDLVVERTAFMRYAGQGWEIPVAIPERAFTDGDGALFKTLFEAAYARFFKRPIEGLDIEVVSWSVKVSSTPPPVDRLDETAPARVVEAETLRRVFDARRGGRVDAAIHERAALAAGDCVRGPAIIVERETSTVVTSSFKATVQRDGCILLSQL